MNAEELREGIRILDSLQCERVLPRAAADTRTWLNELLAEQDQLEAKRQLAEAVAGKFYSSLVTSSGQRRETLVYRCVMESLANYELKRV